MPPPVVRRLATFRAHQGSGMQRTYNTWAEHGRKCAQRLSSGIADKGCAVGREFWGAYLDAQD
jgi:hypothetical protein